MKKRKNQLLYRSIADKDDTRWTYAAGLDELCSPGCYLLQLRHNCPGTTLPLPACDEEHYITATLIITESGTDDELQRNRLIGQTLIMPDCNDGRTRIFNRTLKKGNSNRTWNNWNNIAQSSMDDEITSTEDLVASVTELKSQTKEIKTDLSSETARTKEAEAAITKDAILSGSLNVNQDTDSVTLAYRNIDGTEVSAVDITAATTEKAGVMSAEDKRLIYNWSKEFGKNLSGIYGSSEELNTGQYGFGVVYSGYTSGMIGKSIITKIKASIEPNTSAKLYFIKNDENGIITDIIIQDINREVLNKDTMLNIAIPAGYGVYLYGVEYINDSLNSTRYITRQNIRLGESATTTFNGRFNFEIEVKTIPLEEEINPIKGSLDYVSVGFDIPRTKDSNNWSAIYSSAFEYDAVVTEVIYGIVDETLQLAVVSLDENNVVSEVTYHTFENVEHSGSLAVDIRVKKGDVLFIKNVKWDNSSDRYVV